jgi:hypothetical protein
MRSYSFHERWDINMADMLEQEVHLQSLEQLQEVAKALDDMEIYKVQEELENVLALNAGVDLEAFNELIEDAIKWDEKAREVVNGIVPQQKEPEKAQPQSKEKQYSPYQQKMLDKISRQIDNLPENSQDVDR